jgi:hypothetical protein
LKKAPKISGLFSLVRQQYGAQLILSAVRYFWIFQIGSGVTGMFE